MMQEFFRFSAENVNEKRGYEILCQKLGYVGHEIYLDIFIGHEIF